MGLRFGLLVNYWTEICTDCDNSAQSRHDSLPVLLFLFVRDKELSQSTKCRTGFVELA